MLRILTTAVAASVLLTTAPGQAAPLPTWVIAPEVPAPKPTDDAVLRDVSVVSPTNVWVVGWTGGDRRALVANWNGAAWTAEPTPDPPEGFNSYGLNAVDAVASDNVWAVGGFLDVTNPAKAIPLLLHYDGVTWTDVRLPSGVDGELSDIDMLTTQEGWAVGTNQDRPFILRRDVGGWEPVPTPTFDGAASLESVYATSSNDAWAVGSQKRGTRRMALVLHWDGGMWSEMTIPAPSLEDSALVSVAATSASDVWAVGSQCSAALCLSWVLHLDGTTWRTVPTAPGAELSSVVALAADDVWIFGQTSTPSAPLDHVEHWDGTGFTIDTTVPTATANPHHPASALSLAAASGDHHTGTLWAVGWIQGDLRSTHAIYRNGSV